MTGRALKYRFLCTPALMLLCGVVLILTANGNGAGAQGFGLDSDRAPVSNEEANAFFDRCIENPDPVMTGDSQMEMCACMAVEIQNVMSAEEYEQIKEGIPPGSELYKKNLTYVYGPCLENAVMDYINLDCLADKRYRGFTTDIFAMCQCLSNSMARFTALYGPDLLAEKLHRNPYFEDAMTPLLRSPGFMTEKRETAKQCLNQYSWDSRDD